MDLHGPNILGEFDSTGTSQIRRILPLSKSANYTVLTTDLGKSIRFNHISTPGSMTLPSVGESDDGGRLTFIKVGNARLTLITSDSDIVYGSTTGGSIYSDSQYAVVILEYVHEITTWVIISAVGIWITI